MSRESDIKQLFKKVLEVAPVCDYNPNSYDAARCPFCSGFEYIAISYPPLHNKRRMETIRHDQDCAYLIAKDLSANGG